MKLRMLYGTTLQAGAVNALLRPNSSDHGGVDVSPQAVGFIPARLASTRLPRKLLLAQTGKPLIQHTWEAARRARSLAEVVVAADSPEIADAVRRFGGRCELTGEHPSGADRIAEVVRRSFPDVDVVVNIQGDEPEVDADQIDLMVDLLAQHPRAQMSTLATPIVTREVRDSPSCVKIVCAADGRALYFSRSLIPFCRDADPEELLGRAARRSMEIERDLAERRGLTPPLAGQGDLRGVSPWLLHLGLYAYRREFLLKLTESPPSRLERLEKLEQLRALEAGAVIQVGVVDRRAVGIDTPEDYARFVERVKQH
jgi:3-deoxy-manno-octulosonate cytidylyltransferase (CMP-KDO synthetase)